MIRILKNKTNEDVEVTYGTTTVVVEKSNQRDLAETFLPWQLAAIDNLIVLLSQGTDKYQLNDGTSDLDMVSAIDLIRGYAGAIQRVNIIGASTTLPVSALLTLSLVADDRFNDPSPPSVLLFKIPVPISLRPYHLISLRSIASAPNSVKLASTIIILDLSFGILK